MKWQKDKILYLMNFFTKLWKRKWCDKPILERSPEILVAYSNCNQIFGSKYFIFIKSSSNFASNYTGKNFFEAEKNKKLPKRCNWRTHDLQIITQCSMFIEIFLYLRFKKKIFYEFLTQNNLQIFVVFRCFVNIWTLNAYKKANN